MNRSTIYMDNAATTKVCRKAYEAMDIYNSDLYANPSGNYGFARISKKAISTAREKVARAINTNSKNIFFTSGGTESDNWALRLGVVNSRYSKAHIITSAIEHPAILNTCHELERQGIAEVTYIKPSMAGTIDPLDVSKAIKRNTALISIMYANNEIGSVQEIKKIGEIARKHNVLFHTDAVQAVAHVPIDVIKDNIDMLSASGHKHGGPKGTGFMYIDTDRVKKFVPIIYGGSQENGMRAGTENVAGIVGMAAAIEYNTMWLRKQIIMTTCMRDYMIGRIINEIKGSRVNGDINYRLSNNINVFFPRVLGKDILARLDMDGICASYGSACSSGKGKPSHVLKAIGLNDTEALSSVRFTISHETTYEEIDYVVDRLKSYVKDLQKE